jgi:rhamnulokinase
MKSLALDLGASGGKFISGSFDGKKIRLKEIHRFNNEPEERDGHLFWNVPVIFSNLVEGLRRFSQDKIASFAVDSFCNDYGLLDAKGELISQVYMYRDRRTDGVQEWMNRIIPPEELFKRTGCQRARFNTLVQLAAQIKTSDPDLLNQARCLLFIPELLLFFLCGEKLAEYTIASVSQLYNRLEKRWDPKIIHSFGIPEEIFPNIIPSATKLGNAKADILKQTGMDPFTIYTVGHHDTASAVVAVPSLENHFAYISSGTWSLMGTETDDMITTAPAFQSNYANEGGVGGRNRFSKNVMGLWLIQEFQRDLKSLGISRTFEEMDAEAEKALPFRTIINPDEPIFFEPGNLIGKIQSNCRLWNQPKPETVGEITRCIKESLALAYRSNLTKLEEITGFNYPCVHIIGGGARSALLNRFTSYAIKRPVLAGPYEASAIGNLCTQFLASGEIEGLKEARRLVKTSFPICEYFPEKNMDWDKAYERYLLIKNENSQPER